MHSYDAKSRQYISFTALSLLFIALFLRLVYLQVIRSDDFKSIASEQYDANIKLRAARGNIYDRNRRQLAISLKRRSLYVDASDLTEEEISSSVIKLSSILGLKKEYIYNKLASKKRFVWIARRLDDALADKVALMELAGAWFVDESMRFYPAGKLASHIIGFTGIDDNGLEGAESYYDNYLKGEAGWLTTFKDARRRSIISPESEFMPPIQGYNLVLNIDTVVQNIVEDALDKAYTKHKARSAIAIVMDPNTGDIIALANRPTYDPNDRASFDIDSRRDRAVADMFEPGSVFKIVPGSGSLEEKAVSLEDKFFGENGSYKIHGRILHDHQPHQWLTFPEVLTKSSNIGIAKVAERLGAGALYRYSRAFGFGEKTGIDMPGEIEGLLRPLDKWSKLSLASIPMGQEVGSTAMQLACAISVIANGGMLVEPHIAKSILDQSGNAIKEFGPAVRRRVISSETASKMRDILAGVVTDGTGTLARVPGYATGGKTGTSQKVEPNGAYSHSKFVASFIGFAPVDKPAIAVVVVVDEPRPYHYGGTVAAPVFSEIVGRTLRYLNVPYSEPANTRVN